MNSRYFSGRTAQWLKIKAFVEGEFVVVGWQQGRNGPPCALLARETPSGLEYAGSAFITLSGAERGGFWRAVDRLSTDKPAVKIDNDRQHLG